MRATTGRAGMSHVLSQRLAFILIGLCTFIVVAPVILIFAYIIANGFGALSWDFLTKAPSIGGRAGGIFPAIVGTFYLMVGTVVFALPVGTLAAVYITEYARQNWLTRLVNLAIVNLAGVPSIVYGLFGLGFFVLTLHLGLSLISASLTLACQALALMITASREAILTVPREYRDASLGLGATKWQTIRHVVLPESLPGIVTGAILAMSRAAGETAPILTVGAAFFLPTLPTSPFDQFMALAYHLYTVAANVPGVTKTVVWGVALVLLIVVLAFDIGAIIIRLRMRQRRH